MKECKDATHIGTMRCPWSEYFCECHDCDLQLSCKLCPKYGCPKYGCPKYGCPKYGTVDQIIVTCNPKL